MRRLVKVTVAMALTLSAMLPTGCEFEPMPQAPTRHAENRLTAEYAAYRSARLTDVEYELDFDLVAGPELFSGVATLVFSLSGADAPLTVDFADGAIDSVTANGNAVEVNYNGSFLTLPSRALAEGRNEVRIGFRHPYSRSGQGLHRFVDPEDSRVYLHSHFEPYDANRLFPCFDQPDLKAFYTLQVTAPASWQVVSATAAKRIESAGDEARWTFPRIGPISTYIFPLHAGDYHVWEAEADGIPLRLFARQSLAEHVAPEDWFRLTQQGFAFFQDWFDMPYPYGKYDQLIVPEFNIGGMENVAAVTYSENFVKRGGYTRDERERMANVLLHEMSHMWFGDLVTPAWWDGLWLKEAFATYMAYLAQAEATEFEDAWHMFYAASKQRAYDADQLVTTHPIQLPVGDTHYAFSNFDRITYQKGASVLTQLSHYVGSEAFRQGVRAYLRRHAGGVTRLDDFIAALEDASGRDLTHWVREWLDRAGLNSLAVDFSCKGETIGEISLLQSAPPDHPVLRTHSLQLGLYQLGEGDKFQANIMPVLVRGQRTTVEATMGTPCPTLVYPNHGDWGFVKVNLDPATLDALRTALPQVPDPLLRSMFLQSYWDMVRDARLGLYQYVDLALAVAAGETSERILLQLAASLREAMRYLRAMPDGADPERQTTARRIEAFAAEGVVTATSGSDLQKLWIDTFLAVAFSHDGAQGIRQMLLSPASIGVPPLDRDRRWRAVIALNGLGAKDADDLRQRELASDPSENGRRLSMAAEAAWPSLESKRRWLERIRDTAADLSLARRRAIMANLFPIDQYALSASLAPDILDSLPRVGADHEDAFLLSYGDLIPKLCRPDNVERLADAIERYRDLNPILLRALRVAHQEDARCVEIARLAISERVD